ncbi:c-type cytochrome [Myroides marinus]|uniref:Photosynthetic reaction center cytochrome c subunit n=1 Tax=Myroides marinus TaxID=703342 RepID=A0A165REE7_9FLAO|nr:c-type cytochrome [Myroides marinus]KUF44923.1 hypothetical protein AS361_09205 [Myroides marinus]KZE81262.1 hypothetical protein AV926_08210 [Myroides marinus]MDM1532948.1 c-type cytochrome [Myroides marinus]MDM1539944.1 c-type cytochrome [Myroides marinus]
MKMKNVLSIVACLTVLITLFSFNTNTFSKKGDTEWKNLKVLPKDISNDSLKGLMRGYNDALGVKCSYCHTSIEGTDKLDFAADTKKEKEFARHMITMTHKINAENFNWNNHPNPETIDVVSCTMCHRGTTNPSKTLKK